MVKKSSDRLVLPGLGEHYHDLLVVDSTINARTPAQQAHSLLCARLQGQQGDIRERVEYLAKKRGITFDEVWEQILKGDFEKIDPSEWDGWPKAEE